MTAPRPLRAQAGVALPRLPQPSPERRPPQLRVLPEPPSVRARRLSRLFTALAGVAACFGLFGVVGLHVLLAQGQGEVARLTAEVEQQEQQQQRLRLQVAELESPARVTAAARERLGMVTPNTVVSLAPATLAERPATTIPSPRSPSTTVADRASTGTTSPSAAPGETTTGSTSATRP